MDRPHCAPGCRKGCFPASDLRAAQESARYFEKLVCRSARAVPFNVPSQEYLDFMLPSEAQAFGDGPTSRLTGEQLTIAISSLLTRGMS